MRVLLAALLAITALSGCLAGTELVEAGDLVGEARTHARTMMPSAELAGIGGWEPFAHVSKEGFEANIYVDLVQADGKAPGWIYLFTDGADLVGVAVAAGLGVLGDFREAGAPMPVLGKWSIDSGAAARALQDDPRWPQAHDGHMTSWFLVEGESGPVWTVELYDLQSGSGTSGAVDARTGEVLAVEERQSEYEEAEMPVDGVLFESSGSVTAQVSPGPGVGLLTGDGWCSFGCIEVPFWMPHDGTVHIELRWGLAANDFDLVVLDAAGDQVGQQGSGPGTSEGLRIDLPQGEYTVGIVPFLVVADAYHVQGTLA